MALRDHVRLIDGPLEDRVFYLDTTPTYPLNFQMVVGVDGKVLACEGEPTPNGVPFRSAEAVYAPVMAPDGHQSRADDGCLLFYLAAA